jgi:hypothetical protein
MFHSIGMQRILFLYNFVFSRVTINKASNISKKNLMFIITIIIILIIMTVSLIYLLIFFIWIHKHNKI